jgi:microcystin-dependent protein
LCEPLETTANGKRLVVEDSAACQKTIQTPVAQQVLKTDGAGNLTWTNGGNGSIIAKDLSGVIDMKDGSAGQPINLLNLVQNTTSIVAKMIVMMTDGTIKAWEPSVTADQFIAYWDGSDWKVNTLNTLLPSGQGLFFRNTSGNISVVPNGSSGTTLQMVGTNIEFASAALSGGTPTGAIMQFAANSAPTGWLAANGDAVNRITYAALFSTIGVIYGSGDGSTTFNLPDLRGIFVRGTGSQAISGITYSGTLGTKQGDAMQGHIHTAVGSTSASVQAGTSGITQVTSGNTSSPTTDGTNGTPRTGSETRPANIALLYCIKF